MSIWLPDLDREKGPKYRAIAKAIAHDIAAGTLGPGTRMPPHRILAYALGISPNTTSRAYAECVARGLLQGEIGRGTFVRPLGPETDPKRGADLHRAFDGPIDLSRNLPFPGQGASHLARTLEELAARPDLQALLDYQTGPGPGLHGDAGIKWLSRTGLRARAQEVVVTCGAQHGILAALMAATRPGDLLATETLTYAPVPMMADHLGLKRLAVDMDQGGMNPEALEAACRRRAVKAVYLMPTLQTPTTATMDPGQRAAIARIARAHDLILIEDDVYGPLRPAPPLADLAPERTIYISSTSKCLAPGLRVAFVRAPAPLAPALHRAVALSCWMPPPLMLEIASRWMDDGTADQLTLAQRTEAEARQGLARKILAGHALRADPKGFHIWLNLPPQWQPETFCEQAQRQGVRLTLGSAFAAKARYTPPAVRISLSHEPLRQRVEKGLTLLAALLKSPVPPKPPLI